MEYKKLGEYGRQFQAIQTRVWQDHVSKAYTLSAMVRKAHMEKQKKEAARKIVSDEEATSTESVELSESLMALQTDSAPKRPGEPYEEEEEVIQSTAVMKRLGLAKEDMFTGTEAEALKKLLRTLRWKEWTPDLYFHIRFFSIRHQLHPMSAETKALVRRRWHFILRMLRTLAKIERVLAARSFEKTLECITYIDLVEASISPICWGKDSSLTFDKDDFKVYAQSWTMLSIDAREILTMQLPGTRTPEEVEQTVLSLQYVNDFAKLPTELQHRIVEAAYYIWIGRNRAILRQGHVPQNYYFILLGQAVSKRLLDSGKTETTAILRKGDGFGSVEVFKKCRRQVTVISQSPLHLLVVPKEVILQHLGGDIRDYSADTIHLLSKMWFMNSWPIEHLIRCPHQCKRKNFRRTEIIAADAAKSMWIYVITKGTFRVYQRLPLPKDKTRKRTVSKSHHLSTTVGRNHPQDHSQHCSHGNQESEADPGQEGFTVPTIVCRSQLEGHLKGAPSLLLIRNQLPSDRVALTSIHRESGVHSVDQLQSSVKKQKSWLEKFQYKLIDTLRHLDVFGLEDLCLNPKHPPPKRHLLVISDDVECVMISKNFYLQMATPQLRKKVHAQLAAQKQTCSEVTFAECSLIHSAGIQRQPHAVLDPIDPKFCIHC